MDKYWVGGTASWDGTAGTKWALTSGGAGGQAVPTSADDVFFDGASGVVTCTISAGNTGAKSINCTGFTGTLAGSANITVSGSVTLVAGMGFTYTGITTINGSCTITSAGKTFPRLIINGSGIVVNQGDALDTSGQQLNITQGTYNTNNFNLTCFYLQSQGSSARTLNLGSSTVTTTFSSVSLFDGSNFTFNAGTSTVINTATTSNNISNTGSYTFYNVSFTGTGAGLTTISGNNTFNNLSITGPASAGVRQVTFDSRQTINGTLSTTGTAGNRRVWFCGVTYGIAQTLTINSAPSLTDADFRDIYVIGTAAPISGTRIGDLRGIRGITASTPKTVYWNLAGAQNWSANGWATTSTGTPSTDNFPLAQDTATFTNAGSVTGTITMDAAVPYTGTVDMSGRTSAMTLGGSTAYAVYGNWVLGSGVTQSYSGTLTFSGRNTQTITSAGKTLSGGITIDSYGGTVELADALNIGVNTLGVTNGTFDTKNYNVTAIQIASGSSNVRTINLGSSTITTSADPVNLIATNLTFNAGTSTITTSASSVTVTGGGVTFYNMNFTNTSSGTTNLIGANTFNNIIATAPASAGLRQISVSDNQTITGTLTVAGASPVRRIFLRSSVLGTTRTLTVGTLSATDCDFRDITIAGTAAGSSPTRAGDCGGNTGITFPAAKTVYWNLAGAQNWSATAWAPGSGGVPDINNFPLAQDTAVFDEAAGSVTGTITINAAWNIGTFDASLRTSAMTLTTSTNAPVVYGDWKFGTGVTSSSTTGTITFAGRGTENITSNGISFGCPITIDCATGTVQLADALTLGSARTLTLTSGTFDAVTYNVTTGLFACNAGNAGTLMMGSGTWTLSGTGTVWSISVMPTFFQGTANIVLSDTSATARTFSSAGLSYNKLTIGGATGSSTTTISGVGHQFTELASTKTVAHTLTLASVTLGAWTVTGTAGNVVTVSGTATITIAGARVSGVDYLAMGTTTVSATSPGEFYAGANSTGTGANIIKTAAPTPVTRYWVGGTGTWDATTTTKWSDTSGGSGGFSVPTSADAVVFDSLSNATAYTVTCTATQLRCGSLTMAGPLVGNVTWAGSAAVAIHENVSLAATGITRSYTGIITLTGSTTGKTFTTNGVALASSITVDGVGCGWTLGSALSSVGAAITVTNGSFDSSTYNFTTGSVISSNRNIRSVTFGSGTITLSGNTVLNFGNGNATSSNLTFNAGTSTISCTGNAPAIVAFNPSTFYDVEFTSTAITTASIYKDGTFRNLTIAGRSSAGVSTLIVDSSGFTVTGTLTLSAGTDATMRTFVRSNTLGTTSTLTCAAVASLQDIDFRDITIAGAAAPVSGTRLGDCKGNSGITFGAGATKYWNLAGSNNWSATGWAASSGASPAVNNFPLAQDTAIFESTSPGTGTTTTINAAYNIGTIDMSARTSNTMTLAVGSQTPAIYGNWINGTGTTLTGTGTINFSGRGSQTITSAGKAFTQTIAVDSPSGSVTLQDAISWSNANGLTLNRGTFNASIYNVTTLGGVSASTNTVRTLAIGSGTWTLAGTTTNAFNAATSTNLTVTGTGTISLTSAAAKTFAGGGVSYSGITLDQGGAGTLTITGNNTFANITNSYSATGATNITIGTTTQRVTQWTATGAATRVLTVQGTSASSPGTLILTGGNKPNVDYLAVTGVRAYSLDTTWYAGANSTNNGSLGWYFESGVVAITATISETSTATDAVSAVLIYISSLSETSTATDAVDAPGSTFNPSLSEAATATDAVASTLTLLAQVADALTGTDTVSVTLTISPSVSETATATDEVSSRFLFPKPPLPRIQISRW
jgi:fibronectin-binding autotransporter adhesin